LLRPQSAPVALDGKRFLPPSLARAEFLVRPPLPGRNRLRVAVLPFEGKGEGKGAERGEDLAFSLSHDIAAGLARFPWFDVIAPISFNSEDFLQREDLDYAIDGSVARHGRLIEITVRLLDLTQRTQPVWSESFQFETNELHRLNEVLTGRIVCN